MPSISMTLESGIFSASARGRLDLGEVEFLGLEGEERGLRLGDRLADDSLEMRLVGSLVVRIGLEIRCSLGFHSLTR